ncbi:MAG: hypothetical protein AB1486_19785 [Planctomycetota bacterium]
MRYPEAFAGRLLLPDGMPVDFDKCEGTITVSAECWAPGRTRYDKDGLFLIRGLLTAPLLLGIVDSREDGRRWAWSGTEKYQIHQVTAWDPNAPETIPMRLWQQVALLLHGVEPSLRDARICPYLREDFLDRSESDAHEPTELDPLADGTRRYHSILAPGRYEVVIPNHRLFTLPKGTMIEVIESAEPQVFARCGPACFIVPDMTRDPMAEEDARTPCLPNRFVAEVAAGDAPFLARACRESCLRAWRELGSAVREALAQQVGEHLLEWRDAWEDSVGRLWDAQTKLCGMASSSMPRAFLATIAAPGSRSPRTNGPRRRA